MLSATAFFWRHRLLMAWVGALFTELKTDWMVGLERGSAWSSVHLADDHS